MQVVVNEVKPVVIVIAIVTVLDPLKVSTECVVVFTGSELSVVAVVASVVTVPDVGHGLEPPALGSATFAVTLV